jgi:peroxiredoxin
MLFALLLASCGAESGRFRIEGHLKNMNQAEFYIYSIDGGFPKLDTIRVEKGRFVYETDLDRPATYSIIFPNGSEQAVFGNSGVVVELEGDASHLKEMTIKGTDENEQMTAWRTNANRLTPPEMKQAAIDFIRENPASSVSNYLLYRYLMLGTTPDYKTAAELTALMLKEQPENGRLIQLDKQLRGLKYAVKGAKLPDFQATDINGNAVSSQSLKTELNIIVVWSMWNYESQSMVRKLSDMKKEYGSRLSLMSISMDARKEDCSRFLERDSMRLSTVCDGRMWESPLVQQLGISDVPGNIFIDRQGKVIDVNVPIPKIEEKVKAVLK